MAVAAAPARPDGGTFALGRPTPQVLFAAGLTAVLCAIGLRGGGGVALGQVTGVEMALQLAGGLLCGGAALAHDGRRLHGGWSLIAFVALAALTALSIMWAVEPSDAWLEANRTLAYLAVFASGVVFAREAGAWWPAVLGALVAFSAIVSGFAVLTKIIPGALNPDETFARLREPYDYWNAVGLTAALGMPPALWLGARRHGHAALSALAYPVVALQLVAILLAYSRGALLAAAFGIALWMAVVPLRLRGAAVLAVGALGAGPVMAWTFTQDALTKDKIPLELRETAGLELGLAVLAMVVVMLAAGLAIGFAAARRPPAAATRRTAGVGMLIVLALVPVGFVVQLALSDKGLGRSISDGWRSLTDPDATTPSNDPSRLTAVGSVRARYWDQALQIFDDRALKGAGAGGYPTARRRYREDELVVRHAHGYLVQVAADLGLLGLAANLALLAAFLAAAFRALQLRVTVGGSHKLFRRFAPEPAGPVPWTPERIGLFTLLAVVVTFGVHSFVDWTWFTPGTAVPALLAAGWLAGRGPGAIAPSNPAGLGARLRAGLRRPPKAGIAAGLVAIAVVTAWATWQPLRSVHAGDEAIDALDAGRTPQTLERARDLVETARDRNPLAVQPLFELAVIEKVAGRRQQAQAALEDAVALQPSNPETWVRYAEFALRDLGDAQRAVDLLGPALFLDPRSDQAAALYLEASRRLGGRPATTPGAAGTPPPGTAPGTTVPGATTPGTTAPVTPPPATTVTPPATTTPTP